MHELSIAESLVEQVAGHVPAGGVVRRVSVVVGAMQAIVPDALQWAWQAARRGTSCEQADLELTVRPWRHTCEDCGYQFDSVESYTLCPCGSPTRARGDDDLILLSLDVDVPDDSPESVSPSQHEVTT